MTSKLIFHLFGALEEFERNLIKERPLAGLQAARARGQKGERLPSLDAEKRKLAVIGTSAAIATTACFI